MRVGKGGHDQRQLVYATERRVAIWRISKGIEDGARERDASQCLSGRCPGRCSGRGLVWDAPDRASSGTLPMGAREPRAPCSVCD